MPACCAAHAWYWAQIERLEAEVRDAELLADSRADDITGYQQMVRQLLEHAHDAKRRELRREEFLRADSEADLTL